MVQSGGWREGGNTDKLLMSWRGAPKLRDGPVYVTRVQRDQ